MTYTCGFTIATFASYRFCRPLIRLSLFWLFASDGRGDGVIPAGTSGAHEGASRPPDVHTSGLRLADSDDGP